MREAGACPYLANGGDKGSNGQLRLLPRNHIYNINKFVRWSKGLRLSEVPGRRVWSCGQQPLIPTPALPGLCQAQAVPVNFLF